MVYIYYVNSEKERKQYHIMASFSQGMNFNVNKNTFFKNSSFFQSIVL